MNGQIHLFNIIFQI